MAEAQTKLCLSKKTFAKPYRLDAAANCDASNSEMAMRRLPFGRKAIDQQMFNSVKSLQGKRANTRKLSI